MDIKFAEIDYDLKIKFDQIFNRKKIDIDDLPKKLKTVSDDDDDIKTELNKFRNFQKYLNEYEKLQNTSDYNDSVLNIKSQDYDDEDDIILEKKDVKKKKQAKEKKPSNEYLQKLKKDLVCDYSNYPTLDDEDDENDYERVKLKSGVTILKKKN